MNDSCKCRSCNRTNLTEFLDLGNQPLANNLLRAEDLSAVEPKFPLKVAVCPECWLVQITDIVPPVELFEEYLYFSSFSDAMLEHSKEAAKSHTMSGKLDNSSFVVEVASNDGYLLKNFVSSGIPCLGIEPAKNIAQVATQMGVPTICEFFGASTARGVVESHGSADLILGNNVFAHAPDINDFVSGLAILLKESGRVVLEFPYLGDFIEKIEFDTVYHEHVFYFSLLALAPAFARHGLEIFDIERLTIHGGSLRLFAGHKGRHSVTSRYKDLMASELAVGMNTAPFYHSFAEKVRALRDQLLDLLLKLKSEGKSIAAYGASAKGSTLLNYMNIGSGILDFVVDRSTCKQSRFTPGTHLPILPPAQLRSRSPDYTLLLTWNFSEEILTQQQDYRSEGGMFIIPLPEPHIL